MTEAPNASEEEFGEERLLAVIQECARHSAVEIRDEILRRVRAFLGASSPGRPHPGGGAFPNPGMRLSLLCLPFACMSPARVMLVRISLKVTAEVLPAETPFRDLAPDEARKLATTTKESPK